MRDSAKELAKKSHLGVLDKTILPEIRVNDLQKLTWRIYINKDYKYILPDCIAVCISDADKILPYIYADMDETRAIIVPISNNKLLIGAKKRKLRPSFNDINKDLAACSLENFYAGEQNEHLHKLIDQIGAVANSFLEESIAAGARSLRNVE
jgi:hypothetical protein